MGTGPKRVVVLNDWIADTSTWDGARVYLDLERFTWVFADVRGYGRSRDHSGAHDVLEISRDVLALASSLGFERFSVVGHSMTSLAAIHLGQHEPNRVDRVVLLTPPPPRGFGVDAATLARLENVGRGEDALRTMALGAMLGEHASSGWKRFKVERWRAAADPEAVAAYVAMFARDGVPEPESKIDRPVLAVTGELDGEHMRRAAVERALAPLCPSLELVSFAECGHYPMQEAPPKLVAVVEQFLGAQ